MKISWSLPLDVLRDEQIRQSPLQAGVQSFAKRRSQPLNALRVEKHLDDMQKGKGNLSKDTARDLSGANIENGQTLGQLNPASFKSYSSFLSALEYNSRSRFILGVEETLKTAEKLSKLV